MEKLYYSISEVSKLVDEEQHILRYWEKEFSEIKPRKNRAGNRVYSIRDLSVIKFVKKMLRDDKISLKEAKNRIKDIKPDDFDALMLADESQSEVNVSFEKHATDILAFEQQELSELKNLLIDFKKFLSVS
ncbi:MAG: MerR family transcriptional regulator [Candidatus Kapabacteria bacterium]|nr:MerR family transcriptional regulator [Ignavibacteriota bacterium]MCW5883884.1 MerR family transcriptional regulator [Candidatus Kapabacteria bacterium]